MSKKNPIICNVISLFYPVEGGDENTIKLLSENLINEYGYEVKVLTRRRGGILNNCEGSYNLLKKFISNDFKSSERVLGSLSQDSKFLLVRFQIT